MTKKVNEVISASKYKWYKGFDPASLDPEEKDQVLAYEKANPVEINQEHKKYWDKVFSDPEPLKFNLTYEKLLPAFLERYHQNENVKFDKSMLDQVNTVLYYFCKDPRFFKQDNLVTDFNQIPSFHKGLMIVGGYGTGKSSTMKCLRDLFQNTPLVFKANTTKKLVQMYEYTDKGEKKPFIDSLCTKDNYYFDDLKIERLANNYGIKVNLFDEILFERCENKIKTHISCNYRKDKPDDLKECLNEFKTIYSPQVHDRIFSMFNIIEFNAKSLRK